MTVFRGLPPVVIAPLVIAHQGGWDEILLFFGVPVFLFVVLRYFGIRRERREAAEGTTEEEED